MRLRTLIAIVPWAALASAQGSLQTTYAATHYFTAEATLYFDITVNTALTIDAIQLNTYSGPSVRGRADFYMTAAGGTYVGNEGNPTAWTRMSKGKETWGRNINNPTTIAMETPFMIAPGNYGVGIFHTGLAPAYTDLAGVTRTYMNADLSIVAGVIRTNCPGETGQQIGVTRAWNGEIFYNGIVASAAAIGQGCGSDGAGSVYEVFNCGNPRDLNPGSAWQVVPIVNEVLVTAVANTTIVPPTTANLGLADDENRMVALPSSITVAGLTTNSIWIGSNGHVQLDSIVSTVNTAGATEAQMRGLPMGVYAWWSDLNPSAGGTCHAEVDPSNPSLFHVTWMNVPEYGVTNQNTFQVSIDLTTGLITVKYGSIAANGGVVGFSKGCTPNCAASYVTPPGGATDFSAPSLNAETGPAMVAPLRLGATRPVIGMPFTIEVSEIPFGSLAALLFSLSPCLPGIDLSILGMDGCLLYSAGEFSVPLSVAGTSSLITLTTTDPVFSGRPQCWQGAAIAPGANPFGVILSNAAELTPATR